MKHKIILTAAVLSLCVVLTVPVGGGYRSEQKISGKGEHAAVLHPFSRAYAADPRKPASETTASLLKKTEDASALKRVMWTVLVIWAGIGVYLYMLDRKISRMERKRDES